MPMQKTAKMKLKTDFLNVWSVHKRTNISTTGHDMI